MHKLNFPAARWDRGNPGFAITVTTTADVAFRADQVGVEIKRDGKSATATVLATSIRIGDREQLVDFGATNGGGIPVETFLGFGARFAFGDVAAGTLCTMSLVTIGAPPTDDDSITVRMALLGD